jgi:DNA-binding FrmR family transcriptional regulator
VIEKKQIIQRLKIIRGHLKMVTCMVDRGDNCFDIIQQSRAVRGALRKLNLLILEKHLRVCVFKNTDKKQQILITNFINHYA